MNEQEIEQMSDIKWAETVLRGDGLSIDSVAAVHSLLTVLVEHGATEDVKRFADRLLASPPSTHTQLRMVDASVTPHG